MSHRVSAHYKALEKIVAHPEKFGFEHVVSASIEPTLYRNGGKLGILAQPDVVLEVLESSSSKKELHIIEYKGDGNGELLDRAKRQLENAIKWYSRYRPDVPLENIFTYIISGTDPKYRELLR